MERFTHAKSNRIGGRGSFKTILDRGVRAWSGPIGMCLAPHEGKSSRLGISIGRPVGNAVTRNRIKRLLRESFRTQQRDWAGVYDVVVLVKRHEPMTLAAYHEVLASLQSRLEKKLATNPSEPKPPT